MYLLEIELVPFPEISFISNIEQINSTKANSIVLFVYEMKKLLKYVCDNELPSSCDCKINKRCNIL